MKWTLQDRIAELTPLVAKLTAAPSLLQKKEHLLACASVQHVLEDSPFLRNLSLNASVIAGIAILSVIAIGQEKIVFQLPKEEFLKERLDQLVHDLATIERFYEAIGGIAGYHLTALLLIQGKKETVKAKEERYTRSWGISIDEDSSLLREGILEGIQALSELGEIYPIGGLGDRLNLSNEQGEPLPVACLNFCGRSLLEGIVRDVQAREYLFYKLFAQQLTTPLAMMTSKEKNNHERIISLCEENSWFGRSKESFFVFTQPSVPVITEEGNWSLHAPLVLNLKPGGHGAIWRVAEEKGVFQWLEKLERKKLLIRQINNPVAGCDHGMISLLGLGKRENKAFGLASCERLPNAAEGVLVLKEKKEGAIFSYCVTNIEYSDFERFGIAENNSYPANINLLYLDLDKMRSVIKKTPLPGLLLNMKTQEPFLSPEGKTEILGGRLESMMQNIGDLLVERFSRPLDEASKSSLQTFLTYNIRKKTISTTKRSHDPKKPLLETPEGAFYDVLRNHHELLENVCGCSLPAFYSPEEYLEKGPSLHFLFHPALGPLYSIIGQKIRDGRISEGSELQLEIADLFLENFSLNGSFLVETKGAMGHIDENDRLIYSETTGKCVLKNVVIINKGIDRKASNCYWKNAIRRHEALKIYLEPNAEFHAEDVTFEGAQTFDVPEGWRWEVTSEGITKIKIEEPTWSWRYRISEEKTIMLSCVSDISHMLS